MNPTPTRVLFLLLFFSSLAAAANFAQCLEDFRQDSSAVGGVDFRGQPVSPAQAVGLTYRTCTARCGTDSEPFNWREFALLFVTWLLPWLALLSQLPFGSDRINDFVSIVMTTGSPALAAYSLVLTALNVRSVRRRAKATNHPNWEFAADFLIYTQQTPLELIEVEDPLELTKDEDPLELTKGKPPFEPTCEDLCASISDENWKRDTTKLVDERSNDWTLAAALSVAWVIIAFLVTLADSFAYLAAMGSQGHAVGTIWLWLLCLVIGWLWVPTFSGNQLQSAFRKTEGAAEKLREKLRKEKLRKDKLRKAKKLREAKEKEQSIQEGTETHVEETRRGARPPLRPSYRQSTASTVYAPQHRPSTASTAYAPQPQDVPRSKRLMIVTKQKVTPLNRDEHRFSATFNYSRVMRYLAFVDGILEVLNTPRRGDEERRLTPGVFPRGALISMLHASMFALILQCGMTAAATIIITFTPTVGLGCRSLGYIIYGSIAILIMFLNIISTVLAWISETPKNSTDEKGNSKIPQKSLARSTAISLRKICFLLALTNGTGLILLSCLQFTSTLENCYCNASVLGRGVDSYITISYNGSATIGSRIFGTVLSGVVMIIYTIFVWLTSASPGDTDDASPDDTDNASPDDTDDASPGDIDHA